MKFADLKLAEPLLAALHAEKYETPTPIQAKAIPPILDGKDLLGCAQTGTGKTAAFSLPLLQRIMCDSPHSHDKKRHIRALVLSPTRELASQIAQSIRTYGSKTGVRYAVIFGGVGQGAQVDALRSGIDVLVATPGRLLDLINQRHVDLRHVEFFVLDEADRMLDMGFIHDIRKVIAQLPAKRQNLMFSATMPAEIKKLADSILHHPVFIEIAPVGSTIDLVEQFVYHVRKENKGQLLAHLYEHAPMSRVIVFTRTKHGADRVVRKMRPYGIHAEAIHGDKAQNARQRALQNFKVGKTPMLIATDIAARGIDVDNISHVVNYDIPNEPETYVHRIGRTGRAGASGIAVSFCDEGDERQYLRQIERLIRKQLEVKTDTPAFAPVEHSPSERGSDSHRAHERPSRDSHRSEHRSSPASHDRREHRRDDRHREPRRTEHARSEYSRSEHSRPDHSRAEHSRSEHPRSEHRSSEHRSAEHRGLDHRRGEQRRDQHPRDRQETRHPNASHSLHRSHGPSGAGRTEHTRPGRGALHSASRPRADHPLNEAPKAPRPPGDTTKGHHPRAKKVHRKGSPTHRSHPPQQG